MTDKPADLPRLRDVAIWAMGFLLITMALGWLLQGNDFLLYRAFAPRKEAARREVFEQSKAYNDGMAQELRAMQLDYVKGTPDQKRAIASIVLHRVAGVDLANMPTDVRVFIADMKREQGL